MTKAQKKDRDEAIERLRTLLKPGQEVLCILRHRSRSGMSRIIDMKTIVDGELADIGRSAALAMNDRYDLDREGIVAGGCGMDMGFALVYNLGKTLWPNGTPEPHGVRNGHPNSDGGYALRQRWV